MAKDGSARTISHTGDLLSLQSLLTFALIAPVLKLFHETGHVLAATRFGVPVRRAGVILIALFPLPFVDCSEADFRARRGQRILISDDVARAAQPCEQELISVGRYMLRGVPEPKELFTIFAPTA